MMLTNTLAVTARIYQQLIGDRRFLALSTLVPLIVVYIFKVFIEKLPVSMFADPQIFYVVMTSFIVHFTSYVLCLICIVRERREETLSRLFVNNLSRPEIVLGYLLGYAGLSTLQTILILLEIQFFFQLSYGLSLMFSMNTLVEASALTPIRAISDFWDVVS